MPDSLLNLTYIYNSLLYVNFWVHKASKYSFNSEGVHGLVGITEWVNDNDSPEW